MKKKDVVNKEEDPFKDMTIWEKLSNCDVVYGDYLRKACDVLGLGIVFVLIAALSQAVKGYFRLRSVAY